MKSMNLKFSQSTTGMVSGLVRALLLSISITGSLLHTAVSASESLRENYFPNTEPLGADEIRVVALGTGTSTSIGLAISPPRSSIAKASRRRNTTIAT